MKQRDLFDPERAESARDAGIDAADAAAPTDWKSAAIAAVRVCAMQKEKFTTDDVWKQLGAVEVHEGRAMGGIMRAASQTGVCAPTSEYQLSGRVACHRRPLRVWRSLRQGGSK